MAEVKVRYAMISYTAPDIYGDPYTAMAFRGSVVDVADDRELQRLRELNAVVDPGVELDRPGTLITLPESATDEEVITWVANASPDEIRRLASERPNLVARIVGAQEIVARNARERLALLGQAADVAREHLGDAVSEGAQSGVAGPERFATPLDTDVVFTGAMTGTTGVTGSSGGSDPSVPGDMSVVGGEEPDEKAQQTAYYDDVVAGNRESVTDFISTHPGEAAAVLEAENRRAAEEGREPRVSVVRAVEAAAAHTS